MSLHAAALLVARCQLVTVARSASSKWVWRRMLLEMRTHVSVGVPFHARNVFVRVKNQ